MSFLALTVTSALCSAVISPMDAPPSAVVTVTLDALASRVVVSMSFLALMVTSAFCSAVIAPMDAPPLDAVIVTLAPSAVSSSPRKSLAAEAVTSAPSEAVSFFTSTESEVLVMLVVPSVVFSSSTVMLPVAWSVAVLPVLSVSSTPRYLK